MNLTRRKLGFSLYPMAALWCVVFLAAIWFGSVLGVTVLSLLIEHKGLGPEYPNIILWPLFVYSGCLCIWHSNVFSRFDFVKFAKQNGMNLIGGAPLIILIFTSWLRSMVRGRLDEMYVIAKLEGPFWSVFMYGESEKLTLDKLDSTNSVGFAYLVNIPVTDSIEITIDYTNKEELPQTGISEIDDLLSGYREHLDDFRGTIVIARDYICLTVIGGAWFGKRFGERISKGLDIATKIGEALRKTNRLNSWDGMEMKWDFHIQQFVLQRKSERQLFG